MTSRRFDDEGGERWCRGSDGGEFTSPKNRVRIFEENPEVTPAKKRNLLQSGQTQGTTAAERNRKIRNPKKIKNKYIYIIILVIFQNDIFINLFSMFFSNHTDVLSLYVVL